MILSLQKRDLVARCLLSLVMILALIITPAPGLIMSPAQAQDSGRPPMGTIRDAEIEQLMRDYAAPIFRAAGINAKATKIFLISDRAFNAFVANGQKIFVNVGAIMEAKSANEMIGVLAHETGHMAGGHLANLRTEIANAQIYSVIGLLASVGALATTQRSMRGENGGVGIDSRGVMGVMLGPQELGARALMADQRAEEQAADRSAIRYLNATGQSPKGLLETLKRFQTEALFKSSTVDPYLQSHPLPNERIALLESAVKASPSYGAQDNPALQARHELARAKLVGFVADTAEISRRYPVSDGSLAARYARAIQAYRFGRLAEANGQIDALIAAQPGNAYFHELKGQALLESAKARESIPHLQKAVSLSGNAQPIRVLLGHALIATNDLKSVDEAIRILTSVTQQDDDYAEAFQYLAMAYDRKGNQPMAQLSAAESLFREGQYVEARTQAARAQKQLKQGSPGWLKADDILNYRPQKY